MNVSHVTLAVMTEEEFADYLPRRTQEYAAEGAEATGMPLDEARAFAERQIAELLRDGRLTTGQHFRTVRDGAGRSVGTLWFAEAPAADPPHLFLYDVVIDDAHRGSGLGTSAMNALEAEACARGFRTIRLHVFTTNTGAIRLYERQGYHATYEGDGGQQMTKELVPGEAGAARE